MKIKNNLKLITILPITLLFILSAYTLYNSYNHYKGYESFLKKDKDIRVLKSLSINLARERGLSTLYLLSKQKSTKDLLDKQRVRSDSAVTLVKDSFKNSISNNQLVKKILDKIQMLEEKRSKIDQLKLGYEESFAYFNTIQLTILRDIKTMLNISYESMDISSLKNSYIDSLELMIAVSNERDYVTNMLTNSLSKNRLLLLHIFKDTDMVYAIKALDKSTLDKLETILNEKSFINSIKQTQDIKRKLLENSYKKVDAINWFTKETQKIMGINKVSNLIFSTLRSKIYFKKKVEFIKILLSSLFLLLSLYMFFIYLKLHDFLFSTQNMERVLNKIVNYALIEDTIDLGTTEGIKKTYKIIEESVDKIDIEKSKAEKSNAAKSIFLANMSHEIRTPINGIIGFTELLKKSKLPEQEREYVDIIDKSTESLLEIINNILDLSKIESKKVELDLMPFSPIEEFENVVDVYMPKIEDKGINLSLLMDPDFDNFLIGDIVKVKEVLLNLISNAVKFTPQNGQITVLIKNLQNTQDNSQKVYFEVNDSGVGISKDEMSDIFDAFSQADSTITRKYGGTGLGLTISSSYVSLMGGKLEVSSKKNLGSNFYFTLEFKKGKALKDTLKGKLPNFNAVVVSNNKSRLLSNQEKKYIEYFGSKVKMINIKDLKTIKESAFSLIIVNFKSLSKADFDFLKSQKIATIIIFPTRYRGRLAKYTTKTIFPTYEPLTMSKIAKTMIKVAKSYSIDIIEPKVENKPSMQKSSDKIRRDILIAEDNLINQKLLKTICENFGLNAKCVENGKEAVELFAKEPFDLIFMDIAMPVLDGVNATKAILEYEKKHKLSHTPIIAVTANALKGDRERFLNSGLDDYIAKPAKESDIKELLLKYGLSLDLTKHKSMPLSQEDSSLASEAQDTNSKIFRDLLIIKKSKVETKIFEKVLKKSYKNVDAVYELDKFFELLRKNRYKVVMVDKEIDGLDLRVLIDSVEDRANTSLLLFRSFDTIIDDQMRSKFDEVLINSADETYLQLILENYI